MSRKRTQRPEGIRQVVSSVIDRIKKQRPGRKEEIIKAWRKAVGARAAQHARPISLRRSVLAIETDSSTWMYELSLKKKDILRSLKLYLGEEKIKDVRFKIGDIT